MPLIEHKTLEVELLACVVDVDADRVAVCAIVEDEFFRELFCYWCIPARQGMSYSSCVFYAMRIPLGGSVFQLHARRITAEGGRLSLPPF